MYYDAYPQRAYCGLYSFPGPRTTQAYSAFVLWNRLYRLGGRCRTEVAGSRIDACAAADRSGKALFIANFSPTGCHVALELEGASLREFRGRIIDKRHDDAPFELKKEISLPPYSVLLLDTEKPAAPKTEKPKTPAVHAGLDDAAAAKKKK